MTRIWLPIVLALAMLIAAWGERPPAPKPAGDAGFSAARAMTTVRRIAAEPHSVGSPANARVRNYLIGRLRAIGLQVSVQRATSVNQSRKFATIGIADVENIVAVLPGRNRRVPAVALMAHYDSVPYAPGAGDDGSGTAALIDAATLLARGPKPYRDTIFVITDGEEAGLLGATAFFGDHPLAAHVGAVVNSEARGTAGRGAVFRTSRGNADLIGLWARSTRNAAGNSAADAIARRLPNDTDLSVAIDAGKIGIDAALIDNQYDYHRPTDRPDHLDPGSLQQIGDYAFGVTRALAFAETLPKTDGDAVFFDVLGLFVVHYPVWLNWVLLAMCAAGVMFTLAHTRKLGATPARIVGGVAGVVAIVAIAGVAIQFAPTLLYQEGAAGEAERLAELPGALWMYAAFIAGLVALAGFRVSGWIASMILTLASGVAARYSFRGVPISSSCHCLSPSPWQRPP